MPRIQTCNCFIAAVLTGMKRSLSIVGLIDQIRLRNPKFNIIVRKQAQICSGTGSAFDLPVNTLLLL